MDVLEDLSNLWNVSPIYIAYAKTYYFQST